jgi:protein involved in polysaccharide export with SLBB domain
MPATPLIYVRFGASYPIQVTVLGQIARPGQYPIANTSTIQGAIGAAGGLIPGAQLSKVRLIRMEGEEKIQQTVDLEKFYLTGDPTLLPELKNGDTIVILGNPLATNVKVLGSVENPGNYDVFFQTTVLDVIYMAGGFTNDANLDKIRIISLSGEGTREVKFKIDELLKGVNPTKVPLVSPGDIVYVPPRWFTWSKTLAFIRDITTFVTLYYLIQISNR